MYCFRNIQTLRQEIFTKKFFSTAITESYTTVELKNGIKRITMCHQKTRNALSIPMMETLINNITADNDDSKLRAIILTANGKIFSAGHNLKELAFTNGKEQQIKVFELASLLMNSLIDSPVPIIAQIDGLAAAAGCQLVAQCDIAVCSENSSFSTPGVNFGIFCSTPGVALARSVSKATAMKMLLTGKPISSHEAKSAGLVTEVCETENLNKIVENYCDDIKTKSRAVIELGRRFYFKQIHEDTKTAYEIAGNLMVENLQLLDGREGIDSFIKKRKALWTHRKL